MWPPHVPSYFNAGHHIVTFQTSAYLRTRPEITHARAVDAGALNYTWKELGDLLYQERPDLLIVVNDYDNVDDLPRLITYARRLVPDVKILSGGRLSTQAPAVFRAFDLDAVVESGDLEAGAAAYLDWLAAPSAMPVAGVAVRAHDRWMDSRPGQFLDAQDWALPDVTEIPYLAYDRMYKRDQNKFCGIPERRELVVPAARGCPINCEFCEVPSHQGLRERRLSVERTVAYIQESFAAHPFEYVAFYAPTFTLNRRWMEEFCAKLQQIGPVHWKCATTIAHLDDELIHAMARSGCIRISVGLETLDTGGHASLPRRKQIELERFRHFAAVCSSLKVELNCFVIVALPGTSIEGTARTFEEVRALGGRVRPTMYASLADLRSSQTPREAAAYNRQLLPEGEPSRAQHNMPYYEFVFGREDRVTQVASAIPRRGELDG
jgi:anaerobic magnesium-protoporphyrin IX monomethyl ester cyclase